MFLPRGLPRQPNTVIYAKVMNSKDISVLFKLSKFCRDSGNIQSYTQQHLRL